MNASYNPNSVITKAQLIKALAQFPDDMPILVDGYEGGFDLVNITKCSTVRKHRSNYCGVFTDSANPWGDNPTPIFEAIILSRSPYKYE